MRVITVFIQARSQDLKSGGAISITGGGGLDFLYLSTNCIF